MHKCVSHINQVSLMNTLWFARRKKCVKTMSIKTPHIGLFFLSLGHTPKNIPRQD
jgi:hypothetical protein